MMAKLYRPSIPVEVRCRVALRQLGEMWVDKAVEARRGHLGAYLKDLLANLSDLLGCTPADLRLDHDPPLALRPQERRGLGKKTYYTPDANDPEHLLYRPHGTQFAGSHDVKTRIRGEHGQFSDIVLIKRARRQEKKKRGKISPKAKIRSRSGFAKGKTGWPKRGFTNRKAKP